MSKKKVNLNLDNNCQYVYACGIEYDDFSDGGFSIMSICTSTEDAKRMVEKMRKEYPGVKRDDIYFKTFEVNRFYEDAIIELD